MDGSTATTIEQTVRSSRLLLALAGAAFCGSVAAQASGDEAPAVTPYRPSVSTPAALSAPGWLEVEAGLLRDRGSAGAQRDSLPYTLKLAFTADWGIRLSGDAWVRQTDGSAPSLRGMGDSSVVLKRRFAIDETSAFGLEGGATLTTGRRGIGSEHSDYTVNAIYSADLGDWHTDLNLSGTRVGDIDPGSSRRQWGWAASLSRALTERWGVVGEFSGTRQHGTEATGQVLMAASYNVSKSLTLDAGFARSLRSGVPDRQLFAGFTVLGPRIF